MICQRKYSQHDNWSLGTWELHISDYPLPITTMNNVHDLHNIAV